MKKFYYLLLLVCQCIVVTNASGQWINGITVIPANPTTTDSVTILVDCMFPSGNCDDHTQYVSVTGTDITAGALHCLGVLSVICNYTDTFNIGILPAGGYTFHFQLDAGGLPSPCTPGIVAGPNDSMVFVVSPAVGTGETISQDNVQITPNPFNDVFTIEGLTSASFPAIAEFYSVEGKLLLRKKINTNTKEISAKQFPKGYITARITTAGGEQIVVTTLHE
jgi:hypothetical protein